jgi:hypothetical protein
VEKGLNTNHLSAGLACESNKSPVDCGVDFEDSTDSSSVDAPVIRVGGGESDEGEDLALDNEGEKNPYDNLEEYEDPEEYGERLVDEEGQEEEVGEGRVDKVSCYVEQPAGAI